MECAVRLNCRSKVADLYGVSIGQMEMVQIEIDGNSQVKQCFV